MKKSEFAILRAFLADQDDWFRENEGKFAAFSGDGDLLGTERTIGKLLKDIFERYTSAGVYSVIFTKVSGGALVRIADTSGLSRSARVH